jgi:hypothetical protein
MYDASSNLDHQTSMINLLTCFTPGNQCLVVAADYKYITSITGSMVEAPSLGEDHTGEASQLKPSGYYNPNTRTESKESLPRRAKVDVFLFVIVTLVLSALPFYVSTTRMLNSVTQTVAEDPNAYSLNDFERASVVDDTENTKLLSHIDDVETTKPRGRQ